MRIDFTKGRIYARYQMLSHHRELITKAIGLKKGSDLTVFDATAGFGREAFLLAAMGCRVILFERHPHIALLLEEALLAAKTNEHLCPIVGRMQLIKGCALHYLQTRQHDSPCDPCPDVIYCDPMFPVRNKSAAVKKEMQFLHAVVGQNSDHDAAALIHTALQYAKKRVVVKRPTTALPLKATPHFSIKGKNCRFDIYLNSY